MCNAVGNAVTSPFVTAPPTRPDPTRPNSGGCDSHASLETVPGGVKLCRTCDQVRPHADFDRSSRNKDGRQSKCKECRKAYLDANREHVRDQQRRYLAANPNAERNGPKRKRAKQLRRFGLTTEQYDAMVVTQAGVCAIEARQ